MAFMIRYPEMTSAGNAMLEKIYLEKNSKRTHPCMQSRNDPFRIMHYDVATAAEYTTHTQPLIMKRHNVVPGMFLVSIQLLVQIRILLFQGKPICIQMCIKNTVMLNLNK